MKNYNRKLSQMTLGQITYNQIGAMHPDDISEALREITSEVLIVTGAYQYDENHEEIPIDTDFFVQRYFAKHPSKRFERLLAEYDSIGGGGWFDDCD